MSRTSSPPALACLAILASACSADRTTGPDLSSASAAVAGSPSSLSAGTVSNVAISLSWVDNSPNESGFEIRRSPTGAAGTFAFIATTGANARGYTDASLTPATQYCYEVYAFRTQGTRTVYSASSNDACATTYGPPPAPATVTASPQGASVMVGWSASPSALTYRIERAAVPAGPWDVVASGLYGTQYTDQGRPLEQQVCYRIAAVNQWGEGISTARCTTPPAAPTNLVVTAPSGGGLDVAWTDASAVEGGYEVQRSLSDYQFATVGTAAANATSYHDGTALKDTRYWYRVRATKDGGYSDFSGWADGVYVSAPPGAPTGVSTMPISSSVVDVRWTSGAGTASGFRVERSVSGGAWAALATTSWSTQEVYDYAAGAEVEDCYRVIAFNAAGDSPPSASDCAHPLAAPTNLAATAAGSDAIDVTWTDASAFETGYVVERVECSNVYYYSGYYPYCYVAESVTLPAGSTSWHSTGLAPGATYSYQVYAIATKNGQTYTSDVIPVDGSTSP